MAKNKNEVAAAEHISDAQIDAHREAVASEVVTIDGEVTNPETIAPVGKRNHRATFATDNRKGGYMVRVEGPDCSKFAKRQVPVTRYDGTETVETLQNLIWAGNDAESGKPVALYKFVAHPRAVKNEAIPF